MYINKYEAQLFLYLMNKQLLGSKFKVRKIKPIKNPYKTFIKYPYKPLIQLYEYEIDIDKLKNKCEKCIYKSSAL